MSDVGQVAGAITSVSNLIDGILERADRDGPDKELNESIIEIQNSFANNDLDEQYRIMYKLFTNIGHPPSANGNVGGSEREFRHSSLLIATELKYARQIISRLISKLNNK